MPVDEQASSTVSKPSNRRAASRTAVCSMALTRIRFGRRAAAAASAPPEMARLHDSVPPLVKTISSARPPMCLAIWSRAASSAMRARRAAP